MSITVYPAIEDVTLARVDKTRSNWVDQLDFMLRGSDPLVNTYYQRLQFIYASVAAQKLDTPQIVVLNSGTQGAMLAIVIDLFLDVLKMYTLRSIQAMFGSEGMRHCIIFELRDNNDAWIVEEMKLAYKQKLQESLIDNDNLLED